ncbi:hypothetical protein KN815_01950 [Streptomyces sp. 4503]|uniref:Restriction endonuclease n=1 Tax=Streptomyces niphimycinicus TaxID=2842201 RepID=A0ABS6C7R5_9ACTN|nr:hypothetical protein [Streptomyces niphimycinicus]MBU3862912.1 hypothetical protein [Streptomyces niphimycinicus]
MTDDQLIPSQGDPEGQGAPLHPQGDIRKIVELGHQLQRYASERRIHNVFDDGGYKELLLLELFNLTKGGGRVGNDATDALGGEYEIKTVARMNFKGERKKSLSVTTEHTLTLDNIDRYRSVHLWIVAVFDQSTPEAIYEIHPRKLEPYFSQWEATLQEQIEIDSRRGGGARPHLNNPKIPLNFVAQHGVRVWPPGGPAQAMLPNYVQEGLEEAQGFTE